MAGDYVINRVLEKIIPVVDKSDLSPLSKTGIRLVVPLLLGFASAATLERMLAKGLQDPKLISRINNLVKKDASPADIAEELKPIISKPGETVVKTTDKETVEIINEMSKEAVKPIKSILTPKIQTEIPKEFGKKIKFHKRARPIKELETTDKSFVILSDPDPVIRKQIKKELDRYGFKYKRIKGATKGTPENGFQIPVGIKPKQQTMDLLSKVAARANKNNIMVVTADREASLLFGNKAKSSLGQFTEVSEKEAMRQASWTHDPGTGKYYTTLNPNANTAGVTNWWDQKVATPFLNATSDKFNRMVTNEQVRFFLGMDRDPKIQDMLRDYRRDIKGITDSSIKMGKELQRLAPTKAEQKRLMQIVRGGITNDSQLKAKAEQINQLFTDYRKQMNNLEIMQYSRFDNITRKERTALHNIINGPSPESFKDIKPLQEYATKLGVVPGNKSKEALIKEINGQIGIAKEKLHNYYHFSTATEYAPLMYSKHEGLTPLQKKDLRASVNVLKKKSRNSFGEAKQEYDEMIAEYEKLLKKGSKNFFSDPKIKMDLGYTHYRDDIPRDVQRIIGLIEEAPYPVAKGLGTQALDIRKATMFEEISKNQKWVLDPAVSKRIPANYTLIKDKRFGALNGRAVRNDVYNDLEETNELRNAFIKIWDEFQGMWKYGKVVLNPATHARNTMSNFILAYLGDLNPATPSGMKAYNQARKALMDKGSSKWYKEAEEWGLYNNTFVNQELGKLRDGLDSLRSTNQLRNWIREAMSVPANLYQGNEEFFKTALFINERNKGASITEAGKKAEEFLFNYSDIPPWVKHTKRWVSPFFTFTYKAIPKVAETTIRKPWKIGAIGAAMYGMEKYAASKLGYGKEQHKEQRELLPEWQQKKVPPLVGPYSSVLMPFQDKWGNDLYFDTAYILPYGNIAEAWGQSGIPLRDLLPSTPAFTMAATLFSNTDAFTGKTVSNKDVDSTTEFIGKHLKQAWRTLVPSLAPGGYSYNKLMTGFKNLFAEKPITDWADRPVEFQYAILDTLLGIKLRPANYEKLKQFKEYEKTKISQGIAEKQSALRRRYKRNEITKDEYTEKTKMVLEKKYKLIKQLYD
jgi:hypothetical protein